MTEQSAAMRRRRQRHRQRRRRQKNDASHLALHVARHPGACCPRPQSALGVEVVFHDRAVAAGAIALQFIDVSDRPAPLGSRPLSTSQRPRSVSARPDGGDVGGKMRARCRADNHGGDAGIIQDQPARDASDICAVTVGDAAQERRAIPGTYAQPPKSSMMSLYLTSERLASGPSGSATPSQRSDRKSARHRAVAEKSDVSRAAQLGEAVLRTTVEHGILHLHGRERYVGSDNLAHMRGVEIRAADKSHLARAAEFVEPAKRLQPARLVIIPPVELDEIEPVDREAACIDRSTIVSMSARRIFGRSRRDRAQAWCGHAVVRAASTPRASLQARREKRRRVPRRRYRCRRNRRSSPRRQMRRANLRLRCRRSIAPWPPASCHPPRMTRVIS